MKDWIYLIIIGFCIIVISVLLLRGPDIKLREVYSRDTILIDKPVYIEKPGKIVYRHKKIIIQDTVMITKDIDSSAFQSCIDTTLLKTNLNICYSYPENIFQINLERIPDTIRIVNVIDKPILQYSNTSSKWYEDWLKIGGTFLIGLTIGIVVSK